MQVVKVPKENAKRLLGECRSSRDWIPGDNPPECMVGYYNVLLDVWRLFRLADVRGEPL